MSKMTQSTIDKLNAIKDEFYLDSLGNIRRSTDGYFNRFKAGDLAKFFVVQGYYNIQTPKQRTTTKRSLLVWVLHGNELKVDHVVDHIDGNRLNDHISNLRLIPYALNNRNRAKRNDNTTGVTGICWIESKKCYVIRRTIGNKRITRSSVSWDKAVAILEELKQLDNTYTERHGN